MSRKKSTTSYIWGKERKSLLLQLKTWLRHQIDKHVIKWKKIQKKFKQETAGFCQRNETFTERTKKSSGIPLAFQGKCFDLRRYTNKITRRPEKICTKLDMVKMIKSRCSFATKNMVATSNRQTRYKTEQKNQNNSKIETNGVSQRNKSISETTQKNF